MPADRTKCGLPSAKDLTYEAETEKVLLPKGLTQTTLLKMQISCFLLVLISSTAKKGL